MPELIDKNLLVKTLRYIASNCDSKSSRVEINTRISTNKIAIELLRKQKYVSDNGTISRKGKNFLRQNRLCSPFEIDYTPYGVIYKKNESYLRKLRKLLKDRPAPDYLIDHQPLMVDLTGMRAHYISSEENLYDKKVAMVGDYDSTGIGINLATKVKDMTIFDIDDRLLSFFTKVANTNHFPVKCVKQDLFKDTPTKFRGQYDVFVTDPPYAMGGMKKFIEFGIRLIKDGGVGYIAVPYHESISWTERMLFEVNKLVIANGCVITDTFKNFHRYQTADGLRSSMVRIKKGSNLKAIDIDKMYSYKPININIPEIKQAHI